MPRITVASAKGGVGKTTLATSLAEAAQNRHGGALLADLDPQGSAALWYELAASSGTPLGAAVAILPVAREAELRRRLATYGEAWIVLDCPPGNEPVIRAALAVVDLAVVPVRPGVADLARLSVSLDFAREAGVPALVVLNAVRSGTVAAAGALEALNAAGHMPAMVVPLRESISSAYGRGDLGPELTDAGEGLLTIISTTIDNIRRLSRAR